MQVPVRGPPSRPRTPRTSRGLSRRSRFGELLDIYDLFLAPVASLGERARLASDPALLQRKSELETAWLAELDSAPVPDDLPEDPVAAMRLLATRNRLPQVYRWLASSASYEQIVGSSRWRVDRTPASTTWSRLAQVGLSGLPKLEMATNYWDEMGNGSLTDVHTELHTRMATALDMPRLPRARSPSRALERMALGGLLATNRWLQPELVGMLGLIELQAGPRCRLVRPGVGAGRCAGGGPAVLRGARRCRPPPRRRLAGQGHRAARRGRAGLGGNGWCAAPGGGGRSTTPSSPACASEPYRHGISWAGRFPAESIPLRASSHDRSGMGCGGDVAAGVMTARYADDRGSGSDPAPV